MKIAFPGLIFSLLLISHAFAGLPPGSDLSSINIRTATNAQMYRHGRELFRKGDYREAAQVFQRIIASDCQNQLAHYHLQKIAAQGKEFKDIADFLKNLSCPAPDTTGDNFLPAVLYYEKDADLLLEQLAAYNRRYQTTRSELSNQISRYKNMIAQLEEKTQSLSSSLQAAQKDAQQASLWEKRLKESVALSEQLGQESAKLKIQLKEAKKAFEQETRSLQAQVASAARSKNSHNAQKDLEQKKAELKASSQVLEDLEDKFTRIQKDLQQIESSLKDKNQKIKGIATDLSTIQK